MHARSLKALFTLLLLYIVLVAFVCSYHPQMDSYLFP